MASRLNEDDTQGQNKWADIDDDDEDWAPEAITWGDGTKTTLPHPDEMPPHPHEHEVDNLHDHSQSPGAGAPPQLPASKSGGLPSGKGLVLKPGTQDKPALVAKPPQPPGPAKSPWASLPPVERGAPTWGDQGSSPRASYREPSHLKHMGHGPKEIAADDFSRAGWRDSQGYGGRELYNSQSGRYEPVPDRRGSMRSEHPGRQPSLVHRQGYGEDHPAEPSSAFQTNRTSHDGSFGRRRASSTVSGGSGSFFQRGVKGPDGGPFHHADGHNGRRPSFSGSTDSASHANAAPYNQNRHQSGSWAPRVSPGTTFATPGQGGVVDGMPPPGPPLQPPVDEVEYQKKLMRERVELAKKRRQEEEAREEAARKERIQKKLDAMGPVPDKKSDKKDTAAREDAVKPTQIQRRDGPNAQQAPETTSVRHGTDGSPKSANHNAALAKGAGARRLSQNQDGKPPESWAGTSPRPERLASWASGPNAPSRSVWGSPDNDRGLGNGTFNPDLGRIPGSAAPTIPSGGPPPIAPPVSAQAAKQARPQPPGTIGSRALRYDASGSELASKWVAAVAENDKKISAAMLADQVSRERELAERGLAADEAQPTIKETWRPVRVPGDGTRHTGSSGDVPLRTTIGKPHGVVSPPSAVINPAPGSILAQAKPGAPSQQRPSRFFPTRDSRPDASPSSEAQRPTSPSPPPPTMEGHPVYEGDSMRPHVSLPRPQPIVKLPPSMVAASQPLGRGQQSWAGRNHGRDAPRAASASQAHMHMRNAEPTQGNWQDRINSLLNKPSPPKATIGVDVASRAALDQASAAQRTPATVSLPAAPPTVSKTSPKAAKEAKEAETKPMAEECFEEQEMGSLPLIRLPNKVPEAAWNLVEVQSKPLPKRFLVQPCIMEPFLLPADLSSASAVIRVNLPGMGGQKSVTLSAPSPRSVRGSSGRPSPRSRGGQSSRGSKREASSSHGETGGNNSRGGRGSYRGRASENWNKARESPSQPPLSA